MPEPKSTEPAGQDLERLAAGAPADMATAHEIVGRIELAYAEIARAQERLRAIILEGMWDLRQQFTLDAHFTAFVKAQMPFLPMRVANQALGMVDAWAVARKNRAVRELARSAPDQAVALVALAAEAGVRIEDETDQEVTRILAMKPGPRHQALRALKERADGVAPAPKGKAPDAAAGLRPSSRPVAPARIKEALERICRDLKILAETPIKQGGDTDAIIHLADTGIEWLEQINRSLLGEDVDEDGDD